MKVHGRSDGGLEVRVTAVQARGVEPTRYALALRRRAANRERKRNGLVVMPELGPGNCQPCAGWGVQGRDRRRCGACGGTGEAALG